MSKNKMSLKFKILNFLSGDILRNYLAVGVLLHITECEEILESDRNDESKLRNIAFHIKRTKENIIDIFTL